MPVSATFVQAGTSLVAGAATSARFVDLPWNGQPWIVICLASSVVGYAAGLARLSAQPRATLFGSVRVAAFAAGIATLVIALLSPLDALDDQLFCAHMVQHLLLLMVAAPLLVWSRPALAFLWAFPLPARRALGRVWNGGAQRGMHALMSPLVVWMLCSMVLWFWHIPAAYDRALTDEGVHTLEHACFFVSALMFWSLVLEPVGRRRLDYGSTLIFVATLGVQNGLLGALLTFAGRPLYAAHLATTAAWGLTPLEDQQLAGLIMWIPAGLIHLVTLGVLFVAWLRSAERDEVSAACARQHGTSALPPARALLHSGLVVPLLLGLVCSGCGHGQATWAMDGADPARGPALMQRYGCGTCHSIPGIATARGQVGPPLSQFARRAYIAGVLRNEPENLVHWLRVPQSVVPGNAMPDSGVTEQDARDIAAYLYTLR